MRKYLTIVMACAFLLFVIGAVAQTSGQYGSSSTTPSTSQSPSSGSQAGTSTSGAQSIEGCLAKEKSDFFLIPQSGNPIKLEASSGANLSEHVGHKVKISGTEMAMGNTSGTSTTASNAGTAGGTAGTTAGSTSGTESEKSSSGAIGSQTGATGSSGSMGTSSGTGDELHKLASSEFTVSNIKHEASSCPAGWNPSVPTPSASK